MNKKFLSLALFTFEISFLGPHTYFCEHPSISKIAYKTMYPLKLILYQPSPPQKKRILLNE